MAPGAVCKCLEITEKDDFLQSGGRDNSYCHLFSKFELDNLFKFFLIYIINFVC